MTTLGTRLRQARKKKKLSQKALAELVGIKQQAIQRIERGDVKNTAYIVQLAHTLEVSSDWLATGKEWHPPIIYTTEFQTRYTPTRVNHAPLFSWQEIELMKNLPFTTKPHTSIPIFNDRGELYFVLKLKDDSMQSPLPDSLTFLKNDLLFVQPGIKPRHNDFVIAKIPSLDEAVFRRYSNEAQKILLKPLNPEYPSIPANSETEIIGVVFMRYTQL